MIAEGNETPGGDPGTGGEGRGRRGDGDLFAERRARRAAESGEHALTLRAEAAEATVRTLETHVASLQQRLRDAEEEGRRTSELIDAAQASPQGGEAPLEQAGGATLERELQRASQREYAEQRLRMEAEDRCSEIERESRTQIDALRRRLGASEREAQELAARLQELQQELAEAEQAAAHERATVLRSESSLRARLEELEHRAIEIDRGLEAERGARREAERLLEEMRGSHSSARRLVGELADSLAHLKDFSEASAGEAAGRSPWPHEPPTQAAPIGGAAMLRSAVATPPGSGEMAEALAAAVQRLRARVEQEPPQPQPQQPPVAAAIAARRPSHKHSLSLIGRWRLAIRARRERRKVRREA